jgi:hypothetical protein
LIVAAAAGGGAAALAGSDTARTSAARTASLPWSIVVESRSDPGGACEASAFLQVADVPHATSYAVTIFDSNPRVNSESTRTGPPFSEDVAFLAGQEVRAPSGTHRWGLSGVSQGGGDCGEAAGGFLAPSRWRVSRSVVTCPRRGCGQPVEFPTTSQPLPEPEGQSATGRVRDLANLRTRGGPVGGSIRRGDQTYTLSENSVLQTGDVITTDANTALEIEFVIGGRAGVAPGQTIEMVSERHARLHASPGRVARTMASLGVEIYTQDLTRQLKQPLEIQTNGGILGIRD